jgi:hypothetical protein
VLPQGVAADVAHLTLSGVTDHFGITLETIDAQQPVVIRRLIFRRDA